MNTELNQLFFVLFFALFTSRKMIKLDNISVDFELRGKQAKAIKAVDQVSLHIQRGEVFGIVGTSGAGKSTLLRTINLLERPNAGRVWHNGCVH